MADDVLINKAATIERCVARAREEYAADPEGFAHNFSHQDAAILNIQRACEAALDMGLHIIRLTPAVAEQMKRMVGFRNVAVHDYQSLQLPITLNILTLHLDDFLVFSRQMLLHDDGGF